MTAPQLAFQPSANVVLRPSRNALASSPCVAPVRTARPLVPSMREPKTRLPYNESFSRPNRLQRPKWEPPVITPIPPTPSPSDTPSDTPPETPSETFGDEAESHDLQFDTGDGNGSGDTYDEGGNGNGNGRGGGDDDGDDDDSNHEWNDADDAANERRVLCEALRLSEAEANRATLAQLRSLQAASQIPVFGSLAMKWPALRDRLAANRRFPLQMAVEIFVGVFTKTIAEVQGRGHRFWNEFDFYLSDMALEIFGDAILVWLLSPVAVLRGSRGGLLAGLPKHFSQIGHYSLLQRGTGFVYKGLQFGTAGLCSSMVGHGLTRWLVSQRKNGANHVEDSVELAPILPTSLAWGGFLMTSSNARYQLVNGIEQRLLDPLLGANAPLLTAVTFALRFANCYVGGMQWLPWAKMWNIQ